MVADEIQYSSGCENDDEIIEGCDSTWRSDQRGFWACIQTARVDYSEKFQKVVSMTVLRVALIT